MVAFKSNDLDFDPLRLLKITSDGFVGVCIFGFHLLFNSNVRDISAPLGDTHLQNLSDIDFDRFEVTQCQI